MAYTPAPAALHIQESARKIAGYAKAAGFTGYAVVLATAIALAESNGWDDAVGGPNKDGSYDLGLWQINDKAHGNLINGSDWASPIYNAKMAYAIFVAAGRKFTPWSTFNNGAFSGHLTDATSAAQNPLAPDVVEAGPGTVTTDIPVLDTASQMLDVVKSIGGAFYKVGAWMGDSKNWGRVVLIGLGGALAVGAVVTASRPMLSGAAGQVADVVTKVTPVGAAAKVVKGAAK